MEKEKTKNLEKMFLHSFMLGLAGTVLITSAKGLDWVLNNQLTAESYIVFLGFSLLLGLSLFSILVSGFQVIVLSVKKQEVDGHGNENKQPDANGSVKPNR